MENIMLIVPAKVNLPRAVKTAPVSASEKDDSSTAVGNYKGVNNIVAKVHAKCMAIEHFVLSQLYHNGYGVEVDPYMEALHLEAAEEQVIGIKQDFELGYEMKLDMANRGCRDAIELLDRVVLECMARATAQEAKE